MCAFRAPFGGVFQPVFGGGAVEELITLPQYLWSTAFTLQEDFETIGDWSVVVGTATLAEDAVHYKTGSKSVQISNLSVGANTIEKTVNWNLSSVSSKQMLIYIYSSKAIVGGQAVRLYLSANAGITKYKKSYDFSIQSGWNCINITGSPSQWYTFGGMTWNDTIIRFRIEYYDTGGENPTLSFDSFEVGGITVPAIVLEFDDGLSDVYASAYPYLNPKHCYGSAYIVSNWIGTVGYMTLSQLQELDAAGWTVGNHSMDHTVYTALTQAQIEAQLSSCDTALATLDPLKRKNVAYPGNGYDTDVLAAMISQGMLTGRSATTGYIPVLPWPDVPYVLRYFPGDQSITVLKGIVDVCKSRKQIAMILFHAFDVAKFQTLVDYIISKEVTILTRHHLYLLQSGSIDIPLQR